MDGSINERLSLPRRTSFSAAPAGGRLPLTLKSCLMLFILHSSPVMLSYWGLSV
jgi:hypothetical protein